MSTYYCPNRKTPGLELADWLPTFHPNTLKGAWCPVAEQLGRRICRITLDTLVSNPASCHERACVLLVWLSLIIWWIKLKAQFFSPSKESFDIFIQTFSSLFPLQWPDFWEHAGQPLFTQSSTADWLCQENNIWAIKHNEWMWHKLIITSSLWDRMAGIISTLPSAFCLLPLGFRSHNR